MVHDSARSVTSGTLAPVGLCFDKYHGLGNDFIILDLRDQSWRPSSAWIMQQANRHCGVGFDQLLVVCDVPDGSAMAAAMPVVGYCIANADGQWVGQCGNGARCVAAWLMRQPDWCGADQVCLRSPQGDLYVTRAAQDQYTVRMGGVQVGLDAEGLQKDLGQLVTPFGTFDCRCLFVGNPHLVLHVSEVASDLVAKVGAWCQQQIRWFPEGVNVGFMQIDSKDTIHLRVFERGAGETRCCASGACCAMVAAYQWGLVSETAQVKMHQGALHIAWSAENQQVTQAGPAAWVFSGVFP